MLGPERVPVVTDAEQARAVPEVVVLSAMAHGQSVAGEAIGAAFLAAAAPTDVRERVLACTDLAELDRWIRRAAVVGAAREIFAQ